jgi:hypothetical protein
MDDVMLAPSGSRPKALPPMIQGRLRSDSAYAVGLPAFDGRDCAFVRICRFGRRPRCRVRVYSCPVAKVVAPLMPLKSPEQPQPRVLVGVQYLAHRLAEAEVGVADEGGDLCPFARQPVGLGGHELSFTWVASARGPSSRYIVEQSTKTVSVTRRRRCQLAGRPDR